MEKQILIEQIEKGLSTWAMAKENATTQPNIRYWLKKYELKTRRQANMLDKTTKFCSKCNSNKPISDFYISSKASSYCKQCIKNVNKCNRNSVKELSIQYKGGQCVICGYKKCHSALEFHHLNPEEKDIKFNGLKTSFTEKLKLELDKCILVCANCHREIHFTQKSIQRKA